MVESATDTKSAVSGVSSRPPVAAAPVRRIGRYDLHEELASGGMATVYLGRLIGQTGFSRPVAIKRLHDNLATDPKFVSMLLDEARLAARVRHPNVVATLDVVEEEREVVVVMEYVHGESLALLRKVTSDRGERIPPRIAATIVAGALHGLHAAHEAVDEQGEPLHIVHRDVSPQNILVGVDGVPRVLDFGIAKAAGRMQTTQDGKLKGKFGYMAPEQLKAAEITPRADVYAAAVVFWEALAGRRLHPEDSDAATILTKVLFEEVTPPSKLVPDLPAGADEVVMRGLAKDPTTRYATALEMATEVERVFGVASPLEVGAYVKDVAKEAIRRKSETLAIVERADTDAGQKQRRQVVARVAAGAEPESGGASRIAFWAVAVLVVGGAGYGAMRLFQRTDASRTEPPMVTATTTTTSSASAVSSSAPPPPPSVVVEPAIVDASAIAEVVDAGPHVASSSKTIKKPVVVKKVDTKPEPTPAVPTTTTPSDSHDSDASRDLIPKFRK